MASAEWVHLQGPRDECRRRRQPQDVFHEFLLGQQQCLRRHVQELVPNERIRYTDRFEDPNLPGEMQVTITLAQVSCGTELNIVQEGLPDVIPLEGCYLGWQESLAQLARLVEPEIPD
jgi:uncharacterized protein YndB with AHSA1/START domain